MILLKKGVNFVLDNFHFSPRARGARVVIAILVIIAGFSFLGLLTDKYAYQTKKANIEIKFQTRDERTMIEVLRNCDGNIGDPEAVQVCLETEYHKQIDEPTKNYRNTNLKLLGWVALWFGVVGAYASLLYAQKNNFRLKTD